MNYKKQVATSLIVFFIISLFFRVDFRFKNTVECCSDDYDYFSHTYTIAIDKDFDYSNQLTLDHPFIFTNEENGKIAPVGFPGSGILASPFLFVGNLIDNNLNTNSGNEILNYKILLYSLSPIFYFFLSFVFIYKSLSKLGLQENKYKLLVIISGSGITYFAFERFSMTHVYEMFTISLLIWGCISFYLDKKNIGGILIPLTLVLAFYVRMSNYYIFLIPLIIKKIIYERLETTQKISRNMYFNISILVSLFIYSLLSLNIYGKIVFNPQEVYGTNITINSALGGNENIFEFLQITFINSLKILFGNEFGIFWVSPIIFFGAFLTLLNIKKFSSSLNFLIIFCFLQNFAIVLLWESTAASYGFRYLYSLVPLSLLILYLYNAEKTNNIVLNIVFFMSIFANLSILFFETTKQTQLSMVEIINSFGSLKNYSEPEYVTGVLKSFTEVNSYLIIFTTSLVGVVFFKLLLTIIDVSNLISFLTSLGLPTDNEDFILYLENLEIISINKILLILIFLFSFCYYLVFRIGKTRIS